MKEDIKNLLKMAADDIKDSAMVYDYGEEARKNKTEKMAISYMANAKTRIDLAKKILNDVEIHLMNHEGKGLEEETKELAELKDKIKKMDMKIYEF